MATGNHGALATIALRCFQLKKRPLQLVERIHPGLQLLRLFVRPRIFEGSRGCNPEVPDNQFELRSDMCLQKEPDQ